MARWGSRPNHYDDFGLEVTYPLARYPRGAGEKVIQPLPQRHSLNWINLIQPLMELDPAGRNSIRSCRPESLIFAKPRR